MDSITIAQFKLIKAGKLKKLKSCEVTSDGDYLFTFINAQNGYIRDQAEGLAELNNTNDGMIAFESLQGVKNAS